MKRRYYSQRKEIKNKISLDDLKEYFSIVLKEFNRTGYYDEWFGYECVDGDVIGKAGVDIEGYILLKTRRKIQWPFFDDISRFDEDTLFDIIEFFHDTISHPEDRYFHHFNDCGWHYTEFNQQEGQQQYREKVNELLCDYSNGYLLGDNGEIEMIHTPELNNLMQADLPCLQDEEIPIKKR